LYIDIKISLPSPPTFPPDLLSTPPSPPLELLLITVLIESSTSTEIFRIKNTIFVPGVNVIITANI
jgi:hypothetical protein